MATPTIPPRPSRSQKSSTEPVDSMSVPQVPPRPKRSIERSVSPHRDNYARSPLNDLPQATSASTNKALLSPDIPRRPPSVTLPSIGQEGSEYENINERADNDDSIPEQTKNVAGDLPLYAPTASVPVSTAKSRIAPVTRTDSTTAAVAGIGKLFPESEEKGTSVKSSSSRPQSIYKDDEEHGIPEIGVQVPMYPNAGDVQAPTPSPYQGEKTGIGFFNNGGQQPSRHHTRTKSGREVFSGPPGSYGLHGHGVKPTNDFEKKWYEKHPEDAAREAQGEYGPAIPDNRKEWALSREDLNKLVHESGKGGAGMGSSPDVIGTPDEQIGYIASEEYASRIASPRPPSVKPPKSRASSSHTHVESPLRQQTFGQIDLRVQGDAAADDVVESDVEDDVIHIGPNPHRTSKIYGAGHEVSVDDLAPESGNVENEGRLGVEMGYSAPILASDEVAKNPDGEYMLPAVTPELERIRSADRPTNEDGSPAYAPGKRSSSRGSSRPSSIHGGSTGLTRIASHEDDRSGTPLDNVKEYEPLFPDDEKSKQDTVKPLTAAQKLKRPDLARHHFPSQDIWEDTPDHHQLVTTVESLQDTEDPEGVVNSKTVKVFEKPEDEAARKQGLSEKSQESFLSDHAKRFGKSHIRSDVLEDSPSRPGMKQRFPSQDIWEDTPEHSQLVATVETPEGEEPTATTEEKSESTATKPTIPARPSVNKSTEAKEDSNNLDRKVPSIPDRPKPLIPARPSKFAHKDSNEASGESTTAPATKPKPAVPSRPLGGKIAALKAGFMNDLNNRLQLGPQAPKASGPAKEEVVEEKEKAPLSDARKGRAKGPQRRKPGSNPSGQQEAAAPAPKKTTLSFVTSVTVWEIGDEDDLAVPLKTRSEQLKSAPEATVPPTKAVETEAAEVAEAPAAAKEPSEASAATAEEKSTKDTSQQTGQQDIKVSDGGAAEKLTVFLGGRAPEPGSVVVDQEGVEHVGESDNRGSVIEKTSDGM